jgi:hypothetical protein
VGAPRIGLDGEVVGYVTAKEARFAARRSKSKSRGADTNRPQSGGTGAESGTTETGAKSMKENSIRAELSSDSYCSALGVTIRSPSPVLALCRKLVEVSTYAPETPLDAYRGNTLCISVSIGEGAGLRVASAGNGCPVFQRTLRGAIAPPVEFQREAAE